MNCHGWQHLHAPIAFTVIAMNVMTADGQIVHCSPIEHRDLFSHVLGGYGVFAVILDADLRTVANARYRVQHTSCDVASYERTFDTLVRNNRAIGLAYGRISVAPGSFLLDAVITTFVRETGVTPAKSNAAPSRIARTVFRGSQGSEYGKTLRWNLERHVMPMLDRGAISRNEVMDGDIEDYIDHSPMTTDILHEYFIPRGKLKTYIDAIRPVIKRRHPNLLNITIRDVAKDQITALPYARGDVFAVVMFFHQTRSVAADDQMRVLTRELIDLALSVGGAYYLPYRLHATQSQFQRGYPMWSQFAAMKRHVDPDQLLMNEWYAAYFPPPN